MKKPNDECEHEGCKEFWQDKRYCVLEAVVNSTVNRIRLKAKVMEIIDRFEIGGCCFDTGDCNKESSRELKSALEKVFG